MSINRFTLQLDEIKAAYAAEPNPTLEVRLERIGRIEQMITANEEKICKVLAADFGTRHSIESRLLEFQMIYQACKHVRKHLKDWMKPQLVATPGFLGSSHAWTQMQSMGVVGIMSPWNYPVQLALVPAIAAFAAGNRVWLKPSERSSRTSGFLATLIQEYFHPSEFCVSVGGTEVAEYFAALPFDHLFFTGSGDIGKKVMRAAADHLTPITLELGGKSPAIVDPSANLKDAAASIIYGKLVNGGQTCIAPDYAVVHASDCEAFIQELQNAAQKQFRNPEELTGAIDEHQLARWHQLVQDAVDRGAQAIQLISSPDNSVMPFTPVALLNISEDALIMQEEVFGPILPIVAINDIDSTIRYINERPMPLALYWFGKSKEVVKRILNETRSGGVTLNDTLLHAAVEDLPFGGVGASGMGAYHGKAGFEAFSHRKSVLEVRGFLGFNFLRGTKLARPPYGNGVERLLRWLN
ncbi:MAG: coniferyl aldehyde dehydrogenase [Polynucleobacter sp. 24-46-87]|jgi:coniferyl-aldehyde dehydrogenase|uniref:coniferyl aldehyde dehydrogenase n=1 Tax=unclassified Polynucleobacter TaxID=2640945 RepID=UPI000BCAAA3A|nr:MULTISPECIES: coniferyl aldehyde dehydrogenase [unclassified Polynucleobacter]OYY13568.1 MAG: coniferyl aldehyde dehydrogenase [Polynucleobacter sp. 35-46-11]OZA14463.1 MAG: coniferyl aldehyde dehydrogenase [Polynucleobacter sp. 24-46-87]OZA77494.1 MAG: coniferyl aldehyde dehydrogenase [Polynucleobacter sp. 39-46-10]